MTPPAPQSPAVTTHRHSWLAALALLLVATMPSPAQSNAPSLLPTVQKASFGTEKIDLCRLSIDKDPADPDDLRTADQLRSLLTKKCTGRTSHPAIPVFLEDEKKGSPLPGVEDSAGPASRESYSISIDPHKLVLHGRSSAGLYYALQTLRQLIDLYGTATMLPSGNIEDWPSLAYRGVMMDMSHGGMPTLEEIKRQLDLLARFKVNQYYFYVETNVQLDGYRLLNISPSWTKAEIAEIVRYAADRHIDVVPCIELYGHLHDLYRIERYSSQSALEHGGEANPANPDAQRLLEDWLRQYAALFPSKWFHLGFDEPFELERAGSKAAGGIAPDKLWLDHLHHLAKLAESIGRRPIFWADIDEGAYIFNKYPGLAAGLPRNAIAAPWFYDARSSYDNLLTPFATNHVPIVVATGVADWDNVAPDFTTTFIDIDGFLAAGRKANTLGIINTVWSDSALALHTESYSALAYGAAAAWQSIPVDRASFFTSYTRLLYPAAQAASTATAFASIQKAQDALTEALGSETSFRMWDDPFVPATLQRVCSKRAQLRQARLAAEEAEDNLLQAAQTAPLTDEQSSLLLAARMIDYTGMRFIYALEIADNFSVLAPKPTRDDVRYLLGRESVARNHSRAGDLMDLSGELAQDYRKEWLQQYRPWRLETAMARWRAEQELWRSLQARVWDAIHSFKDGDPRPTLDQLRPTR
jgi:hypothetical protein